MKSRFSSMEPSANSVMDDISATISPMREVLSFAFIVRIYRKYAYYILNCVAGARGVLKRFLAIASVAVDEVVPRVVRGIDVDHLDVTRIRGMQELQHFEIVALDVKVFRRVEVDRLLAARTERLRRCG